MIDLRATYGGMTVSVGLLLAALARDSSLHAIGLHGVLGVMVCMASGRTIGILSDGPPNVWMWTFLAGELAVAAAVFVALRREGAPKPSPSPSGSDSPKRNASVMVPLSIPTPRTRRGLATVLTVFFAATAPAGSEERLANGYSAAPLAETIFTAEQVATEVARVNNWLIENHTKLDPNRRQTVREGLYALLSSHVSRRHADGEPLLPNDDDLLMRTIFSWAEPLGVYGAHHVYNELVTRSGLEEVPEMPALAPLPDAFETGFEGDTLTLRSVRGGWSVRLPFWFMPFALSEFDTKNGPRTQLVMLGTGTSKHESLPGHSQSTIRLFAGPGQVGGDFARYWGQALGFDSTSERIPLPIEGLTARKRFDAEARIHSELVSWAGNNGPLVVYYAGAPGPYEKNRVHYLDFVRSLRGER